jgi:hypothetical protein
MRRPPGQDEDNAGTEEKSKAAGDPSMRLYTPVRAACKGRKPGSEPPERGPETVDRVAGSLTELDIPDDPDFSEMKCISRMKFHNGQSEGLHDEKV